MRWWLAAVCAATVVLPTKHPLAGKEGYWTLLDSLVLLKGVLEPNFEPTTFAYDVQLPFKCKELQVLIGLDMDRYNLRHLPHIYVDSESVYPSPLEPNLAKVALNEWETDRTVFIEVADPVTEFRRSTYVLTVHKHIDSKSATHMAALNATDEFGAPLEVHPPFDPAHRNLYHVFPSTGGYIFWYPQCQEGTSLTVQGEPWVNGQYYPVALLEMKEGRTTITASCQVVSSNGEVASHPYILTSSLTHSVDNVNVTLMMEPGDGKCTWIEPNATKAATPNGEWFCKTGLEKSRFIALFDSEEVQVLLRHHHDGRASPQKHRLYANVPTYLPTPQDQHLVLSLMSGASRREWPVFVQHKFPSGSDLHQLFVQISLMLADGTCAKKEDADHVVCIARRPEVNLLVHWNLHGDIKGQVSATLIDADKHETPIEYGVASKPIVLSSHHIHYSTRHFTVRLATRYSAPRDIHVEIRNEGPDLATPFGHAEHAAESFWNKAQLV